jgi:hypothetical protein
VFVAWDYPRTIPAKFGLMWFSGFRGKDLNVIFNQNMPNLHNWYKSTERKISLHFAINISGNSPFGTPALTKNAEKYE